MSKQLSDIEEGQIIAYYDEVYSIKSISAKMGRDWHTIGRIICLHINGDSLDRKKGTGLKRKTSAQMDRAILREVKRTDLSLQQQFRRNLISVMDQREFV